MPDSDTLALVALLVVGLVVGLVLLERVFRARGSRDPAARRREHASAARTNTTIAMVCVGFLVLALLLGRILLGEMALVGIAVFTTLAVVRRRMSR